MPRVKAISIRPIIELIQKMNEVGPKITEIYNWAKGIQEDGLNTTGPRMTDISMKEARLLLIELEKVSKPAREFIQEVRASKHFSRNNPTPLSVMS